MADTYSADWAAAVGVLWPYLPPVPAANGTVSLSVAIAPRREVGFHWRYDEGAPVEGGAGNGGEPALALTLAAADASDVLSGRVEPSVAYMRGRLKAVGDGALLLAFLASTTTDGFKEWRRRAEGLSVPG